MRFTVVIPLYNKASFIARALRSVLAQSHAAAEIVIVDDGSIDGGPNVVRAFPDPRIRLITQENRGVSAARNTGIDAATSPFVALLDADDLWKPNHLQTLARLSRDFPECEVLAAAYSVRNNEGRDREIILRGLQWPAGFGVISNYFDVASRSEPPLFSSAIAMTRRAMKAIGGFPEGIAQGEDLLTWARLAARFKIAYSTDSTAIFWNPTFESGQPTRAPEADDRVSPALELLLESAPAAQRQSLRRYIALWHKMRGSMYLAAGDRAAARREFGLARRRHAWSAALLAKTLMTHMPAVATRRVLAAWAGRTRPATNVAASSNP